MFNSSNLPIQALWVTGPLGQMEQACLASFIRHGHSVHLYSYQPGSLGTLPEGVVGRDAAEIIPSDRIFKYRDHNSYAGFSNFFRYELLFQRGGWWVDTDVFCLRKFDFESDYLFAEYLKPNRQSAVNGNVIKAPPGSEFLRQAREFCNGADPKTLLWGQSGPHLMTSLVRENGLQEFVQPYPIFNPFHWFEWKEYLNAENPKTRGGGGQSAHCNIF
jgi:hypothetical protein